MKNKKLLFNLLAVLTGITLLTLSATGTFNNQASQVPNAVNDGYAAAVEYLASLKNNQVTGTIDPDDVIAAEQMSLKSSGLGVGIEWEAGGPDNFAGRTRALIFDKRDQNFNTLYAASVSGGLWKSTTGGIFWEPVQGTENIMNITCMIQAANGKIYVGTGETFSVHRFAAFPGFMGNGIYVSDDGVNFSSLPSTVPVLNDTTSTWAYVSRIAVHPTNEQVIFAATNTGLKYSADGGNTWVNAKTSAGAELTGPSTDVKIGPDGVTAASVNNMVYISATGLFDQFENVSTGTTTTLPFASIARAELAIAPQNPNVIYAVVVRGVPSYGQLENIYKSSDKGGSWRVVGPGGSTFFNVFGADNVGDYANTLIVHPNNPDIIYLGGKNLWKGTKIQEDGFFEWKNMTGSALWFNNSNHHSYAFKPNDPGTLYIGTDRGIYRSVNNLVSFQNMNRNYMTEQCYSVAFNTGKRILAGTQSNGVIFISESGNTDKQAVRIDENFALNGGQVAMSVINQRALIWSTAVPTASVAAAVPIYRSDDLGATVSLHAFHPVSTTIRNFQPAMLHWESLNYPQSRDSVTYFTEEPLSAGTEVWVRSANSRYPFRYTLPTALASGDSLRVKDIIASRLFYGLRTTNTAYGVFMTKAAVQFTSAATWFRILNPVSTPQSFAISKDGNYFWVGTNNGRLYRLGNLHNAYNTATASITITSGNVQVPNPDYVIDTMTINFPQIHGRVITGIAVDPQDANHVIITLGNYGNDVYVYRSTNALSANPTFTSVQGNLPKMPVYSALIEMNDPNIVILGTERGIWTTTNINSPNWTKESGSMGDVAVFQIKQQLMNAPSITVPVDETNFETFPGVDNYGKIYAATFGRGVFKTTRFVGINELPNNINPGQARLHVYPNPATETIFINHISERNAPVEVSILDLSGRVIKQQGFGIVKSGNHTLQMDIIGLKKGIYMIQLNEGGQVKSNKLVVR